MNIAYLVYFFGDNGDLDELCLCSSFIAPCIFHPTVWVVCELVQFLSIILFCFPILSILLYTNGFMHESIILY